MLHCWCTFIEDEKRVAALSIQIKKLFFFFYPHTLTIRLKRPVYRGFSGEGKCEGKLSPLTLALTPSQSVLNPPCPAKAPISYP